MKKVTVAIALFNNAQYVERCVESVINQTYNNLEIIIVDDGSKDESLLKCQQYKYDRRVRIISKENGGLSSVRQKGLDEATGDFICFIDADDYLINNHIECMVNNITTSGADVCLTSVRFEDSSGHIITNHVFNERDITTKYVVDLQSIQKGLNQIRHKLKLSDSWNKLYRLSFLKDTKVSFEHPKGYNGSDTIFNHKLVLHCPSYSMCSNQGYVHVIYSSSAVHRRNRKLFEGSMLMFNQFYNECLRLDLKEQLTEQLAMMFMEYVRTGMQDAYNEDVKEKSLIAIREESKKLIDFYKLDICVSYMYDKGLKLFTLLYMYFPITFVKYYLKNRSFLLNN